MEAEGKKGVSFALWVPLTWYVLASSRGVSRWLHPDLDVMEVNYLEGTPIDRGVFLVLMFLGVWILARRRIDWAQWSRRNGWIVALFLYMGLSIGWSDFAGVSFKRWIKSIGDLVMVLIVLTEEDPLEAISTLLRRCFYLVVPLSVIFVKYYRSLGVVYDYLGKEAWIGVTPHKNTLGQVVMIAGVYFIWNILRARGKRIVVDVPVFIMGLWLLWGSDTSSSKTSIVLFLTGIALLVVLHWMRSNLTLIRRFTVILIFLIAFFSLAVPFATSSSLIAAAIEASGRDKTLTQRTDLWDDLFEIGSQHPVLGTGYGSFWIGDLTHPLWEKHFWRPTQGHNGYIDVYLELGLIGLALTIGVIVLAYRGILRTFASHVEFGKLQFILLSLILVNNITESSLLRGANNLWFLFLLVAVSIPAPSEIHPSEEVVHQETGPDKMEFLV